MRIKTELFTIIDGVSSLFILNFQLLFNIKPKTKTKTLYGLFTSFPY